MSDLAELWALQGKTFDDETRRRIESRAEVVAHVFFKASEPRAPIPEPKGKTDFYWLRLMQGGWIDTSAGAFDLRPALAIVAVLALAGALGLAIVSF